MHQTERHILDQVDHLADDILDFTCRLVAEPSTLLNEASVLEVMEGELTRLCLEPVRVPFDVATLSEHPGFAEVPWSYEGRYNVVGTKPAAASGGRSAIFNGHLDVVSPEPLSLWTTDPYGPVVKDGWLYGRGAGDMKGGVAAMTYAVAAIDRAGLGLRGPVTVEGVIEEECSGNGALACLAAGYDGDAALVPEPSKLTVLGGEIGVFWFKISLFGVPTHVATAQAGVNAIEKCYVLIAALRELEAEMNRDIHPAYRDWEHPINFNVGVIKGGDWPSTVPAAAEMHCRLSAFPGTSFARVRQLIAETVDRAAGADPWLSANRPTVEFYGLRGEGHLIADDLPVMTTLSDCHTDVSGQQPGRVCITGSTDVRAFHFFGRAQATCYGPDAESYHAADERVNVDSIITTAKVYALFLARWCGIVE